MTPNQESFHRREPQQAASPLMLKCRARRDDRACNAAIFNVRSSKAQSFAVWIYNDCSCAARAPHASLARPTGFAARRAARPGEPCADQINETIFFEGKLAPGCYSDYSKTARNAAALSPALAALRKERLPLLHNKRAQRPARRRKLAVRAVHHEPLSHDRQAFNLQHHQPPRCHF